MPVPGPRTQYGPVPGYDNPGRQTPTLFNRWNRPGPVFYPGETPGTMVVSRRGMVLAWGQVRRLWRQSVNLIPAQAPYSWTTLSPTPERPGTGYEGVDITRALRYMTRSLYMGSGHDNTIFAGLHTVVPKFNRGRYVTGQTGNIMGRPTVRNRVASFGSRVPTLNPTIVAAENPPVSGS